ncbi:MAG: hypothetical protein ACLGH0_10055, partial [Thermoanaerobaculia bacterium]
GASTASGATDHSAHHDAASVDHAAMGHGATADHTAHAGHAATPRAGAHDQHAGMQHTTPVAGADPHAQHGATPATTDPHAQHRMAPAPAAPVAISVPRSNAEIRAMQPSATLKPDAFDAPAPVSVGEAAKAKQARNQS